MTLSKIKKFGTDYDSDEIVARAKDVNPIIDLLNAATDGTGTGLAVSSMTTNTINETTSGAGVTVDGTVVKDYTILPLYAKVVSGNSIDTEGAVALTAAQSGTTFLVDKADGLVFTTPDSGAGDIIGCTYKFLVTTSITSGAFGIAGATTDNLLIGGVTALDKDTANVVDFFSPDGTDDDVFSSNGGTTGGVKGTALTVTCVAADKWFIEGTLIGDGDIATPFA